MTKPSLTLLWKFALFTGPLLTVITFKTQFVSLGTAANKCIALWAFGIGSAWAITAPRKNRSEIRISLSETVLLTLCVAALLVDLIHRTAQPAFWTEAAAWIAAYLALRRILPAHPRAAEGLVWGLLAAFLGEVGWAAAQYAGWVPPMTPDFPVTGSFDNPAALAIATFAALPALTIWRHTTNRWATAGSIAVGALIITILYVTASRTAMLAWLAVLVVAFLRSRTGKT